MSTLAPTGRIAAAPWILSDHRALRIVTLFLLYVAQGLPLGLINFAIPGWMAQNGTPAAALGSVLALATLPWTFKLAYGVVMDRYCLLAMGRRRPWIIVGQIGMAASLLALAVAAPGVTETALLSIFVFALGLSSAVQDVATDGLAADILPGDEIERVNGVMFGGQMLGIAIGTGLGGFLIAHQGLPAAAIALTLLIGIILALVLAVRERPGERLLPWSPGAATQRSLDLQADALRTILRDLFAAMKGRNSLLISAAFVAASIAPGILLGLKPIFAADLLGWEKDSYANLSSQAQLFVGLPAALLAGVLLHRMGARRGFLLCALLTGATALLMLLLQAQWTVPALFVGSVLLSEAIRALRLVAAGSLTMRMVDPAVAATQFAIYMALLNLGSSIGSAAIGWLDGMGGMPAMFAAVIATSLLAAGLALAARVGR